MNERHDVLLDILCLANCLSRELSALNAERSSAGISGVNAQILHHLATHEDEHIFQKDIEEAFSIRRSTVSKVVHLMEQKDLLRREPFPHDARLKRLILTDKGREVHAVSSREFADFEAHVTRQLSGEEIAELRTLLGKISSSLESNA